MTFMLDKDGNDDVEIIEVKPYGAMLKLDTKEPDRVPHVTHAARFDIASGEAMAYRNA